MSSRHVLEKFIVDNLYFICNLNLLYPKQKFTWLHKYLENYDQMAAFKIFAAKLCNGFLNIYLPAENIVSCVNICRAGRAAM